MDDIGECKDVMTNYLSCMKKSKGLNDPECRNLAKSYLACRMDRCVSPSSSVNCGLMVA
jgi:cytochrome c oxidase assembly protein subunit 19